jgi:hypothetical protein
MVHLGIIDHQWMDDFTNPAAGCSVLVQLPFALLCGLQGHVTFHSLQRIIIIPICKFRSILQLGKKVSSMVIN